MRKLIIVLSLLMLLSSSCDDFNRVTHIHFSMTESLPLINVLLNGRPAKLLIDTGAMSSVLNVYSADEYGFNYTLIDGNNFRGAGGNVIRSGFVSGASLRINGKLVEVDFKGLELSSISRDLGIVGILGSDYLNDHDYIIDYSKDLITFKNEKRHSNRSSLSNWIFDISR